MIDIPETGAVFIIGDSYLKNNQENYFFIKNDPVQQIYANYYGQNGVLCESGRLFVWGHNQYGQLGISGPFKEMVTKPTLVREFKNNKLKVKDVAFGYQFTVVLTHNNKIFYAGRSIFPPRSMIFSFKDKFQSHSDTTEFTDVFVELSEFEYYTELEIKDFERVYAGGNHFVVQTQCGKLIGWGQPVGGQLGQVDVYRMTREPMYLGIEGVEFAVCGNEYTLVVTHGNQIFVTGKFNSTYQQHFIQMNTRSIDSGIAFLHVSIIEEVCVITDQREIYISKSRDTLDEFSFHKLKLMEQCDKIVQLESGSNFLAFVTETDKFFTNYREPDDPMEHAEFHELDRFSKFRITGFKCGLHYILVKGIPKPVYTNIGFSVDDPWTNMERIDSTTYTGPGTGDGFSQASTNSPWDEHAIQQQIAQQQMMQNQAQNHHEVYQQQNLLQPPPANGGKRISPQPFYHAATLHGGVPRPPPPPKHQIRFIDDGIEVRWQKPNVDQYLGAPVANDVQANAAHPKSIKEETQQMILQESQGQPVKAPKPKVRIKTPMPRVKKMHHQKRPPQTSAASSGPSTDESDHSVDDELNRKPKENKIHKFFREAKEKWLEFEESCKESNRVVPDDRELRRGPQTRQDYAIAQHLPNSFICSIQ